MNNYLKQFALLVAVGVAVKIIAAHLESEVL